MLTEEQRDEFATRLQEEVLEPMQEALEAARAICREIERTGLVGPIPGQLHSYFIGNIDNFIGDGMSAQHQPGNINHIIQMLQEGEYC